MKGLGLIITCFFFIFFQLYTCTATNSSNQTIETNAEYIKTSCNGTLYPYLCYKSLYAYAARIHASPRQLAHTALLVALREARSTSKLMTRLAHSHNLKPHEAAAIKDCVEEVSDSIDEMKNSVGELQQINSTSDFTMQISDVQTWVSAALTYEDTCMDGFEETSVQKSDVKFIARKHILKIAHLTSNALALVNRFAEKMQDGAAGSKKP
uniref:Pectinesterase inhibitor domain-containing protein n=1 Tax=Kalanchoe fedtschenkoi TaxID=63787 RepID=A0A7N0U1A7_KALFE